MIVPIPDTVFSSEIKTVFLIVSVFLTSCALARRFPRWAILSVPTILPLYLLRLRLGFIRTTILELLVLGVFAGATTVDPSVWRDGWQKIKPWHGPLLAWMMATIIAIVVAPNHLAAFGLWRAYILEPLFYFVLLAATLKTDKDREHAIHALIVSTVFVAAWAVFQFATGLGIPHPWDTALATRRATGPFPFPNALALFCAPIATLCLIPLLHAGSSPTLFIRKKIWYVIGFLSASLATLLAKSVGGSLAILLCTTILLLWNKRTRLPVILFAIFALGIVALVPVIRIPTVQTLSFQGWSGKVRLIIWKETIEMLKEHPLFGAGFGAYPDVIKPYHKATFIEIFQFPHNILLNFWSETGLLGIAAFTWLCVTWIRLSRRSHSYLTILPLIAMLAHGLVDVPYFKNDLAMLFWILAMISIIPTENTKKQISTVTMTQ